MNAIDIVKWQDIKNYSPVVDREIPRLRSYAILALIDLAVFAVSFLGANAIYLGRLDAPHGITMLAIVGPIYLLIAALNNAYTAETIERRKPAVARVLQAFAATIAAVLFIAYSLKAGAEFSRVVFMLGIATASLLLPTMRLLSRRFLLAALGGTPFTTVVIRDGVNYRPAPHDVVITPEQLDFDPSTSDPLRFDALARVIAPADRVIVACPAARYSLWASVLRSTAVDGEILADENDPLGVIAVRHHHGRRTMMISAGPLHLKARILKRSLDLAGSIGGLAFLAPLFLLVAIIIKLESRGPVFFRQDRIGRDNRIFRVWKFRSMYVDQCDEQAITLTARHGDSRITRVGAVLRKTSIDELPQLLNVLFGQMSIVGPRPHAMSARAADLLYWDVDPRYRHRHSVKPGLTGLAQVRGFRGATERPEDLTNRLTSDLEYLSDWSIWRDLWIIVLTLFVLRHENAF